jgi:hypothetical protein
MVQWLHSLNRLLLRSQSLRYLLLLGICDVMASSGYLLVEEGYNVSRSFNRSMACI